MVRLSLSPLLFLSGLASTSSSSSSVTTTAATTTAAIGQASLQQQHHHEGHQAQTDSVQAHNHHHHRELAYGDFEAFNSLVRDSIIRLPDTAIEDQVAFIDLTLNMTNIRCTGLEIGDVLINFNQKSNTEFNYMVDILDLDLNCVLDYTYKYGRLPQGYGNVEAYTDDNTATTMITFESQNYQEYPPSSSKIDNCLANVEINNLEFSGDFVSNILDTFERLTRNRIEREIESVVCNELSSLGTTLVKDFLNIAEEQLEPYLKPLSNDITDPLFIEQSVFVPPSGGIKLLDFMDTENNVVSKWFNEILQQATKVLGTKALDTADAATGSIMSSPSVLRDLGINILLRKYVLDEDKALSFDLSELPFDNFNGILFEGHDTLTETTITLQRVRIYGLDSFTKLDPIISIGQHTIQSDISWDYLTIELDAIVDMKPSTLPDAIIEEPKDIQINENIQIKFGIENVDVIMSFLLALDEDTLGNLELGSLLNSEQIMSCLLPIIVDGSQFTGLDVKIVDVQEPVLDGFVSEGIDRIVTHSVEAAFAMYKSSVLKAVPSLFQTKLRDILNQQILDNFFNAFDKGCTPIEPGEGFVDYRDLLLPSNQAKELGGTGDEPYGDMPPKLFNLIQSQYFSTQDDGSSSINDLLIGPITSSWSGGGEPGTVNFPSAGFSATTDSASESWIQAALRNFEFSLTKTRIENLDTVMPPTSALQATQDPYSLNNTVSIGTQDDPVNMALSLVLSVDDGEDSPLTMHNEMDIRAGFAETTINAILLATMKESGLLNFPLRDLFNFNCWLATIPFPTDASNVTVAIRDFLSAISDLRFDVDCLDCSSQGLAILPDVLGTMQDAGVSDTLKTRLSDIAAEFIGSEYTQDVIDGTLLSAAQRCPHNAAYTETPSDTKATSPNLSLFSQDSLETLVFGASEVLKALAVVVAESHAGYSLDMADPLTGQKQLEVPTDTELLDFTQLAPLADSALTYVREYLVAAEDSGSDLKVNSLIRSLLSNDDNVLSLTMDEVMDLNGMQVGLKELRVAGLDSVTNIKPLDAIGSQTVHNVVGWRRLALELTISVNPNEQDTSRRALQDSSEITVAFELKDVEASLAMLLALDVNQLGSVGLGSILEIKNILPCVLSAAQAASLTETRISVGSIQDLSVTGFREDELSEVSAESSQIMMSKYGDLVVSSLPGLFDVSIRAMANNVVDHYMSLDSSTACPSRSFNAVEEAFIDFRDLLLPASMSTALGGAGNSKYGDLFRIAKGFLNEMLLKGDPVDGRSSVNEILVEPLTREQSNVSGTIEFSDDLLNQSKRVQVGGLDASIQLRAWEARVENLDTVGTPLSLLQPVMNEAHHLNNSLTVGADDQPVKVNLRFLMALTGDDDLDILNDLEISLDLHSTYVAFETLMRFSEGRLYGFPLRDLLDLNCWLAAMPASPLDARGVKMTGSTSSLALADLAMVVAELKPEIKCLSCTSPGIQELAELISDPEAVEDVTAAANRVLEYVTQLLGGRFLQLQFDRLLNEAARRCPHSPLFEADPKPIQYEPLVDEPEDSSLRYIVTFGLIVVALLVTVGVLVAVIRCGVRRRHNNWVETISNPQAMLVLQQQAREMEIEKAVDSSTPSMFQSPDIPLVIRWIMPIIILGNIAFFLSGHLSLGATVDIDGEFAGEKVRFEKFFEFSMAQSGIDIWRAGGRGLALLLLCFSGIWPYTKCILTFVLWFLSPNTLAVSKRGSILLWLDWLAKWSMLDVFVLVVTITAFRVSILSPELQFLPPDFYNINLMVVPLWGLYANMTAQLISQLSSHVMIHYHRRIANVATKAYKTRNNLQADAETVCIDEDHPFASPNGSSEATSARCGQRDRLCKHAFLRPHRGESDTLVVPRSLNVLLSTMSLLLVTFVIIGCAVPTFSQDIVGIVGVAVEAGQDFASATAGYSVFTMVEVIMDQARYLDYVGGYIGLGSLSTLVILSVLIVPIIQTLALLRQWFFPSTMKTKSKLTTFIEILHAWQYTEVYLLSIFVASWQLGPISEFMINAYCGSFKEMFAELVYYGLLKPEDAQCFRVDSKIEWGSCILLLAAILLALLNTFVMKAVKQYFRDKQEAEVIPVGDGISTKQSDSMVLYSMNEHSRGRIRATPVLFTDTFRWLLRREDQVEGTRGWVLRQEEEEVSSGRGSYLESYANRSRSASGASGSRRSRSIRKSESSRRSSSHRDYNDFDQANEMPEFDSLPRKWNKGNHDAATVATMGLDNEDEDESLCYSASVVPGTKTTGLDDVEMNTSDVPRDDTTIGDGSLYVNDRAGFADEYDTVADGTLNGVQLFADEDDNGSFVSGTSGRYSDEEGSKSTRSRRTTNRSTRREQRDDESRKLTDDELLADAIHAIYGKKGDSIEENK